MAQSKSEREHGKSSCVFMSINHKKRRDGSAGIMEDGGFQKYTQSDQGGW